MATKISNLRLLWHLEAQISNWSWDECLNRGSIYLTSINILPQGSWDSVLCFRLDTVCIEDASNTIYFDSCLNFVQNNTRWKAYRFSVRFMKYIQSSKVLFEILSTRTPVSLGLFWTDWHKQFNGYYLRPFVCFALSRECAYEVLWLRYVIQQLLSAIKQWLTEFLIH